MNVTREVGIQVEELPIHISAIRPESTVAKCGRKIQVSLLDEGRGESGMEEGCVIVTGRCSE